MATIPIEIDTLREMRSLLELLNNFDKPLPLSKLATTYAARVPRDQTARLRDKINNLLKNADEKLQ